MRTRIFFLGVGVAILSSAAESHTTHHHKAAATAHESRHHGAARHTGHERHETPKPSTPPKPTGTTSVPAGGIKLYCGPGKSPLMVRKMTQGAGTTVTVICR